MEEAILKFSGNVFVIFYDRWFLGRIATHIIAYEGEGNVLFFEGNYTEYAEDFKRRFGIDADHTGVAAKHRRLTR